MNPDTGFPCTYPTWLETAWRSWKELGQAFPQAVSVAVSPWDVDELRQKLANRFAEEGICA
jgi:hypothetical protein